MQSALASLRDIEGIIGSFLLDERGNLLARDMPSMFDDDTLSFASARMGRLRAALETGSERFEGCTARFGAHLLILRPAAARSLCVMCPVGTNMAMLEMGINLIARRLSARSSEPPPSLTPHSHWTSPVPASRTSQSAGLPALGRNSVPPAAAPAAPEPRESEPPSEPEPTRLFRGRPLR